MHGANVMDGKIKVFSLDDLTSSAVDSKPIKEKFFVEVPYGVHCVEHFALEGNKQEFFISGIDDGTVQIFDYTKNKQI